MGKIRKLPPDVVHQIAAGEVIARPASVVKELVENALDAGARRITVSIEGGGRGLIQVADDGCGMGPEDLPLAIAPHATSKLMTVHDLERVTTLGFRGEALASIAAIADVIIISRPDGEDAGAAIEVAGGVEQPVRPAGAPPGTRVAVRNLFHNVPARRKFLRSDAAEARACCDTVADLALAYLPIDLRVEVDGALALDLRPATDPARRIADVFGDEVAADLVRVEEERGDSALLALVAPPHAARGSATLQRTYLNGRPLKDPLIQAALHEAYRGLLLPRRHPVAFLFLAVDPEKVDVNVHPTKREVRFQEQRNIFALVSGSIRRALDDRPDVPHFAAEGMRAFGRGGGPAPREGPPAAAPLGGGAAAACAAAPSTSVVSAALRPSPSPEDPQRTLAAAAAPGAFIQLHGRYIVHETPDGFEIIDPHALHERVLYARLVAQGDAEAAAAQRLLVPEVVPLEPAEIEAFRTARDALASVGFDASEMDGGRVLLRAVPAGLPGGGWAERFRDVLSGLGGKGGKAADLRHEVRALAACKAAVKFGDRLSAEEISSLLAERGRTPASHLCPHGRPTALRFTLPELDRRFQR